MKDNNRHALGLKSSRATCTNNFLYLIPLLAVIGVKPKPT